MHLEMEKALLTAPLRLPSLKSENLAVQILTGNDINIGFEDYLNGILTEKKKIIDTCRSRFCRKGYRFT